MLMRLSCLLTLVLLSSVPEAVAVMYSYVDQYGVVHFTNVPADPRYREVPGYDAITGTTVHGRYGGIIKTAADSFALDPELIRAIIKVESSFDPYAVSEKGAMGLMQLMPDTAREMNVSSPFQAEENIMAGSRYLRKLLDTFDNDLELGLAAYNAGPNRVLAEKAIPKIPETERYVQKVLQEYARLRAFTKVDLQ